MWYAGTEVLIKNNMLMILISNSMEPRLRWVAPTRATTHGLSRSLPDPASDCTATCILVLGYLLNAYLVYP